MDSQPQKSARVIFLAARKVKRSFTALLFVSRIAAAMHCSRTPGTDIHSRIVDSILKKTQAEVKNVRIKTGIKTGPAVCWSYPLWVWAVSAVAVVVAVAVAGLAAARAGRRAASAMRRR
uniref:Uncharacterized protein n=1 Tax=Lotharella globosa TaxID=91324 RepID=A0A7S3Z1V4_9EUKA